MSRFRLLGFLQKSVSYNAVRKHKTAFEYLRQENSGLRGGDFSYTRSIHSWCRGVSGVDVGLRNTGAFLNKRYFHATGLCQGNFYEVLGVPKDANQDDIKNAFHVLAKKWHPDTNKNNPGAKKKFQEIREAFETLKDTQKKAQYDKTLRDAQKRAQNDKKNTRDAGQGNYSKNPNDYSAGSAGGFHEDYFYGAFSNIFSEEDNYRRDGADIHVDATISFTQAIFGGKVVVRTITGDVLLKIPEGVQPGHTVVMKFRGIPMRGGYSLGDQYVHFRIILPTYSTLNERQRALMEKFAKAEYDPEWRDWKEAVLDTVTDPGYLIQFSLWVVFFMFITLS